MRVALCQVNTVVGGFIHNVDKICEFLRKAAAEKTELAIFPELCLSGYPPLDLLDRPGFVASNAEALLRLQRQLHDIPNAPETIILGSIMANPNPKGRAIHNAAVVLHQNETVTFQPKRLLPTYDVFDEARYFEPGKETRHWASPWGKLGLSVCEDAWFDDTRLGRQLYTADPATDLKGADFVVNISASPFEMNKRRRRQQLLAGFVKRLGAPLIYVNQVGANDEILFDGGSLIYSAAGDVLYEMPAFREGMAVVDFEPGKKTKITEVAAWQTTEASDKPWDKMFVGTQRQDDDLELLHSALVTGIRDYFRKTGFKKAVIGLSGGIDSAVVACLAAEALGPRNVLGVSMPSQFSSTHSLHDAEELARVVGLEYRVLSLKFINTALLMELKPAFQGAAPDVTEENIQARLRSIMLMALGNKRNGLVLTTGNKSELGVGYCTTYGDMAGALAPLGDVYKTRVYKLAEFINSRSRLGAAASAGGSSVDRANFPLIPKSTMTKPPSAELRPNQTDQDSLPPYDVLDKLLEMHFEGLAEEPELLKAGFAPETVKKILHLVRISEFKRRQAAPALKVTSKAFGLGRRIPVAKA